MLTAIFAGTFQTGSGLGKFCESTLYRVSTFANNSVPIPGEALTSRVPAEWMWTLAFGHHEDRMPTHGYACDARGGHGGVRKELAARLKGVQS